MKAPLNRENGRGVPIRTSHKEVGKKARQSMAVLGMLFAMLLSATASWGQPVGSGAEQQVNTTTTNSQKFPRTAMDGNGNFAVVWESWGTDGSENGVYAQRFDNSGSPLGNEFRVNTTTASNQQHADVAMNPAGNFVVAWMSQGQDGDEWGVYAQRYDASGNAQGGEISVNTTTAGSQREPRIAMADNGDFAVVWADEAQDGDGFGVFCRRFDANGAPKAAAFQVNTHSAGHQGHPDIAMAPAGNFVVTWQSNGQDGSLNGVYRQAYNASGQAQGSESQVATTSQNNQQAPSIGIDENGNHLVAWTSYAQDGDNLGIFARRFDASGNALSSEFAVNSTTSGGQDHPHVAVTRQGNALISWSSYGQDGSLYGVYVQLYGVNGSAKGGELLVNTRTNDFQQASCAAWSDSTLDMQTVWMDGLEQGDNTHDGDGYGIYRQGLTLGTPAQTITAVCQNLSVYLDAAGSASIAAADLDGGTTSNAPSFTLSASQTTFTCADIGPVSVTLTATVSPSLSDQCVATLTVIDTTRPSMTCPTAIVLAAGSGSCTGVATYIQPSANDNCGALAPGAIVRTAGLGPGSNFPVGVTTETWTATDPSGNVATCSFTVTVEDQEAPVITCPANVVTATASGTCAATVSYAAPATSDNCTGPVATQLLSGIGSGGSFSAGVHTETWQATDAAGNSANCSFTVTVQDQESPVAACPPNMTVPTNAGCAAVVNYNAPNATDNCTSGFQTNVYQWNGHYYKVVPTPATLAAARTAATAAGGYLVSIGSQAENNFIFNLVGGGGCWIGLNDEVTEGLFQWMNGEPVVFTNWGAGEPNNAGNEDYSHIRWDGMWNDIPGWVSIPYVIEFDAPIPSVYLSAGQGPGKTYGLGTHTETWTARDAAGNLGNCSFTITVEDQTAPSIICPPNITVNAPAGQCAAQVGYPGPTVSDNCTSNFNYYVYYWGGHYYQYHPWATDLNTARAIAASKGGYLASIGSAAENSFAHGILGGAGGWIGLNDELVEGNFQWQNGEPVTYTNWGWGEPNNAGNEDYTQLRWDGQWNDLPAWVGLPFLIEFDNPITSVYQSGGLGSLKFFPVGTTTETWTAIDDAGNAANCSFTVTVNDLEAPTINCPGPVAVTAPLGWPGYFVGYPVPSAGDNCGASLSLNGRGPGNFFPLGTSYEVWTATDASGNAVSCTIPITVYPSTGFKADSTDVDGDAASASEDLSGGTLQGLEAPLLASELEAFPNPFREGTTLRFSISQTALVHLEVFATDGNRVAVLFSGELPAKESKEVEFKPEGLPSGIYYYRLRTADELLKTGKLILQR